MPGGWRSMVARARPRRKGSVWCLTTACSTDHSGNGRVRPPTGRQLARSRARRKTAHEAARQKRRAGRWSSDAYDPLLYGILLIVLAAVVHLLLQALGLDATLQLFSRLVASVGG